MNKIGIIAGGGSLPLLIAKSLSKRGYLVFIICIKNFAKIDHFNDFNSIEINITSFSKILNNLKLNKVDKIIMAGNIHRPSIKDIKFDIDTIKLIKSYLLEKDGDNNLLISI